MIKYEDFFRDDIINVFTDASIKKVDDTTFGCPGYAISVASKNKGLYNYYTNGKAITLDSTNNQSEIYAIFLGLYATYSDINLNRIPIQSQIPSQINLFSDSKISISGLREWIFNWRYNPKDNLLYSSSGKPVANQHIFLEIINMIIYNNIPVNFYHIDGHKSAMSPKDIVQCQNDFTKFNMLYDLVDRDIITEIVVMNNQVDHSTRNRLGANNLMNAKDCPVINLNKPVAIRDYTQLDLNKYRQLIERRN